MVIVFNCIIYMVISHLHRRSLHSSIGFNLVLVTQPKIPLAFLNRSESISDLVKEDVYNQCRSVLERSLSLGQLQHNHSNGERFFPNLTILLLILREFILILIKMLLD